MQLSAVDANLLVVLHALLDEQHVARAARRVGLSPSAASHALARLRDLFDDPLLTRNGRGVCRTPRAESLLEPLQRVIGEMELLLRPPGRCDPARLRRAFRLATTDHVRVVMLGPLDARVRTEAPGVDIHGLPFPTSLTESLRAGGADVIIGVFTTPPPDAGHEVLFRDRLVAVVRRGHPATERRLTAKAFAAFTHVLVAPMGTPGGIVDRLLAEKALTRRVARTTPSFFEAALLVSQSDAVTTLPERLVGPLLEPLGLVLVEVPLDLPRLAMAMIWPRRLDADPEQRWFRGILGEVAAALGPIRSPRVRATPTS